MDSITTADAGPDPLTRYRWTARVLVVLAADPESLDLIEQKRQIESLKDGAAECELVVVQPPAGSVEARTLRIQLDCGNEPFQAVLVGKWECEAARHSADHRARADSHHRRYADAAR